MSKKRVYDDDDGRTIADMSGLDRPNLLLPRTRGKSERPDGERGGHGAWESSLTPEERRITIMAALKAALLVALVFIVGLGAVIGLMVLIW